jgi:hypothetical protein
MAEKKYYIEEYIDTVKDKYLSGIGSTTIAKELSLPKHYVLKIINDLGIKRNLSVSEDFYSKCWEENGKWFGYWICEECCEQILYSVNKKSLLYRNFKRKKICKKCSLNKQVGEGNPFYDKKHGVKTKEEISKKCKILERINPMSNPIYRKKAKDNLKKAWDSGKLDYQRAFISQRMKDLHKNNKISSCIRSKAEDELKNILTANSITVIPNFKLEGKIYDLYLPDYNLLIEYNGDYWHCNPIKYSHDYFNEKKSMTAKELWNYDDIKKELAINNGFHIETIWEYDYKHNKNIIIEKLNNYERKN